MENEKITALELLKLIADDKAPKKIKVDNEIYNFHKGIETSYILEDNEDITLNFNYYIENDLLNKKDIEILPEENEMKEILFKTLLNDGYEYEDRYMFKGKIEELVNFGFKKLKSGDLIEELKIKIGKNDNVYYKKSGLGYFIAYIENEEMIFMSGVPMWWIGDEEETNYYTDLEELIKASIIEKLESKDENN